MTCLTDRVLSGAKMKLHINVYVGDVFLYTLGLSMPIFKKNLHGDFWEKVSNFWYYIKMIFYAFSQKRAQLERNLSIVRIE